MRRLLLIPILLACVGSAHAAVSITYVQGCVNVTTTAATVTCAMGSSVTSGNLLLVMGKNQDAASAVLPSTVTFSSSSGVACTWVTVLASTVYQVSTPTYATYAWGSCLIPSTGSETVQMAWSGVTSSVLFTDISVGEYSVTGGTWANPVLDVAKATATYPASTTCTSGTTASTSNANDLIVGVCSAWNAGQTWGAVAGYTNRAASSRNTNGWYDKSVTSTGTQVFTKTITSDTTLGVVAALKVTPTSTCTPTLTLLGVGRCG